jgi:enhancing lycopene biosynthesis protein 2
MRTVGILLAGCGRYDGSDVRETANLALALERRGFRLLFLAPDVEHGEVVDHTRGEAGEATGPRRVLEESARLAGGPVHDLGEISETELDALVIPGGGGVVRHLCTGGSGPLGGGPLHPDVERLMGSLARRGAPIAGLGLAKVVLDRHAGRPLDPDVLLAGPEEVQVDEERNLLYAAASLRAADALEAARGVEMLVESLAIRLGLVPADGSEAP